MSLAPTYSVDPSLLSNRVVVLWTSGRLKRTSGLSAESGHKHDRGLSEETRVNSCQLAGSQLPVRRLHVDMILERRAERQLSPQPGQSPPTSPHVLV